MPPPVTPKPPSFVNLPDERARQVFDAALDRLSPVQRQVFLMRLRSGSDLDRIAVRLGLPRDSARASLAYAVAQLRMMLSDAPLDKQRNDWLQRCQQLLIRPARRSIVPAVEIELPGSAAAISVDTAPALIVDSRQATSLPSPWADAVAPPPALLPSAPPPATRPSAAAPAAPADVATAVTASHGHARLRRPSHGLWPRLPAALGLLVLAVAGFLVGYALWPSGPGPATPVPPGPHRVPPLNAPAAPLTASDFRLVLLRQQHPGLLEDLDFYVWLSEQDALQ